MVGVCWFVVGTLHRLLGPCFKTGSGWHRPLVGWGERKGKTRRCCLRCLFVLPVAGGALVWCGWLVGSEEHILGEQRVVRFTKKRKKFSFHVSPEHNRIPLVFPKHNRFTQAAEPPVGDRTNPLQPGSGEGGGLFAQKSQGLSSLSWSTRYCNHRMDSTPTGGMMGTRSSRMRLGEVKKGEASCGNGALGGGGGGPHRSHRCRGSVPLVDTVWDSAGPGRSGETDGSTVPHRPHIPPNGRARQQQPTRGGGAPPPPPPFPPFPPSVPRTTTAATKPPANALVGVPCLPLLTSSFHSLALDDRGASWLAPLFPCHSPCPLACCCCVRFVGKRTLCVGYGPHKPHSPLLHHHQPVVSGRRATPPLAGLPIPPPSSLWGRGVVGVVVAVVLCCVVCPVEEERREGRKREGRSHHSLSPLSLPRSGVFSRWCVRVGAHGGNDPAAGSPTTTLLRLLLPLGAGHRPISAARPPNVATQPPHHKQQGWAWRAGVGDGGASGWLYPAPIGSNDGRCVQMAGTQSVGADDPSLLGIPRSRRTVASIYPQYGKRIRRVSRPSSGQDATARGRGAGATTRPPPVPTHPHPQPHTVRAVQPRVHPPPPSVLPRCGEGERGRERGGRFGMAIDAHADRVRERGRGKGGGGELRPRCGPVGPRAGSPPPRVNVVRVRPRTSGSITDLLLALACVPLAAVTAPQRKRKGTGRAPSAPPSSDNPTHPEPHTRPDETGYGVVWGEGRAERGGRGKRGRGRTLPFWWEGTTRAGPAPTPGSRGADPLSPPTPAPPHHPPGGERRGKTLVEGGTTGAVRSLRVRGGGYWEAEVSLVIGINQTNHSTNQERPCTTVRRIKKGLAACPSRQRPDPVTFPVLSQIKPHTPRLVVPFRQFL